MDDIDLRPADRSATTRLADGRTLAWSEWGPADGRPVLFCTGAAMSGALAFGGRAVDALGVRLIAPDRAGLGRSGPHPGKTLASFADDVAQLSEQLGLASLRVVGFSQGGPFALALAHAGLVERVALVSAQDDLGHPAVAPLLPAEVAAMVAAARADPQGFAAHVAGTASAGWLWGMIIQMSGDEDRQVYGEPRFAALYRLSLDEGFAQGAAGYARDLAVALGEWPFRPEDIDVEVDLWFGGKDSSPVHSPDFGAALAARLPRSTRTLDPAPGGAILWSRAGEILARLLQ